MSDKPIIDLGIEEYYEDRLSNCCQAVIYFQTDICSYCNKHTEYTMISNPENEELNTENE
jgi:hypothetical protein